MVKIGRPIGEVDLTGGRTPHGEQIESGAAGFSGSGFTSTGRLGGLGSTSDGIGSRDPDGEPADRETDGLTDAVVAALADVASDITDADADGSALDGPGDPDDRPPPDDRDPPADLVTVDRPRG